MYQSNLPDLPPFDDGEEMIGQRPSILQTVGQFFKDLVQTFGTAIIIAGFVIYFVAQTHVVHGHSMEPNLYTDQRLIVEKVTYRFDSPERGDIVVIDVPDSELPLIKRVIGLPGEMIEIRNNQVFINGVLLEEPYLADVSMWNYSQIVIPDDHIFVMGDNRDLSRDSRYFGSVDLTQIRGRAWVSFWPLEDMGLVE